MVGFDPVVGPSFDVVPRCRHPFAEHPGIDPERRRVTKPVPSPAPPPRSPTLQDPHQEINRIVAEIRELAENLGLHRSTTMPAASSAPQRGGRDIVSGVGFSGYDPSAYRCGAHKR